MSTIVTNEIKGVNDVGVLQPTKPIFSVHGSTNSYIQTSPIVLSTVEVNHGNMYNTSNGVVTFPITGRYWLAAQIYCKLDNTEYAVIRYQKSTDNGQNFSNFSYGYRSNTGGGQDHDTVDNSQIVSVNANDQMRLLFLGTAEYYDGVDESWWSGYLIG
tara:strand:- start:1574 stop:2047 length:474 start_codon:yes stop_codon:yes gene_type:complete